MVARIRTKYKCEKCGVDVRFYGGHSMKGRRSRCKNCFPNGYD